MFLSSVGSLFHNVGADNKKVQSAVLLSALEIVFGRTKETLSRELRLIQEGTR